jgi:hypothetical protein
MSSQMRVCPGSIGWVVVDQLAKRMYLRKNDGSIIKVDDIPATPIPVSDYQSPLTFPKRRSIHIYTGITRLSF